MTFYNNLEDLQNKPEAKRWKMNISGIIVLNAGTQSGNYKPIM